ncbi:MAG: thioredoxin fold domain-containing protein [Sulfurimonas sp.]|jgi:thiol:disulfide interchange protein DsbC
MKKILLLPLLVSAFLMADISKVDAQRALIQNVVPNSKFTKYEKAVELDGFYRVYFDNGQLLYVNPLNETIVFGEVWNKEGKSYTMHFVQKWKEELANNEIKNISIDKLLKPAKKAIFNKGTQNNYSFVLFTDPECSYCKTVEKFFSQNDTTVYYNFTPLPFHKNAKEWSEIALSSKDFKQALNDIHLGNVPKITITEDAKKQLEEMEVLAKELKVTGTPKIYVIDEKEQRIVDVVTGADIPKLEKYIK